MITYTLPGYFCEKDAMNIKKVLQGKTYFKFQIEYGGIAHNYKILVSTEESSVTVTELSDMVIYYMASNLKS